MSKCGWSALVLVAASCATRQPPVEHPDAIEVPAPDTTKESPAERSPSTGRIEGVYLVDDGVLVALATEELASIERCHRAGRPLGWALLSVGEDHAVQLVEAEASVSEAAGCARANLALHSQSGEVLIYLRFL